MIVPVTPVLDDAVQPVHILPGGGQVSVLYPGHGGAELEGSAGRQGPHPLPGVAGPPARQAGQDGVPDI